MPYNIQAFSPHYINKADGCWYALLWFPSNMDFILKSSPSVSSDHVSFYHMARASSVCSSAYLKWMQHRGGLLLPPCLTGQCSVELVRLSSHAQMHQCLSERLGPPQSSALASRQLLFFLGSLLHFGGTSGLPWVGPSASTSSLYSNWCLSTTLYWRSWWSKAAFLPWCILYPAAHCEEWNPRGTVGVILEWRRWRPVILRGLITFSNPVISVCF